MRSLAFLGAAVSLVLAACALHQPVHVEPDYPPPVPFAAPRDAGRE